MDEAHTRGGGDFRRLASGRSLSLVAAVATLVAGIIGVALVLDRSTGSASDGGVGTGFAPGAAPGAGGYANGAPGLDGSALEQFRQCLREHGVTGAPRFRDRGTPPTAQELQALQACSRYLPARPDFDGDGDHGRGFGPSGAFGPGGSQQPDGSRSPGGGGGSITGSVGGSDV